MSPECHLPRYWLVTNKTLQKHWSWTSLQRCLGTVGVGLHSILALIVTNMECPYWTTKNATAISDAVLKNTRLKHIQRRRELFSWVSQNLTVCVENVKCYGPTVLFPLSPTSELDNNDLASEGLWVITAVHSRAARERQQCWVLFEREVWRCRPWAHVFYFPCRIIAIWGRNALWTSNNLTTAEC